MLGEDFASTYFFVSWEDGAFIIIRAKEGFVSIWKHCSLVGFSSEIYFCIWAAVPIWIDSRECSEELKVEERRLVSRALTYCYSIDRFLLGSFCRRLALIDSPNDRFTIEDKSAL